MTEEYQDWRANPVKVGDVVHFGVDSGAIGKVVKIRESDADYNDDLGRAEQYPPRLFVQYGDEPEEDQDYCDGYNVTNWKPDMDEQIWQFDDIEVIKK